MRRESATPNAGAAKPGDAVRFGIGGRLGLAFAVSAALAIVACIVGWLSYEHLSRTMRQISRDDLPATIAATRLTQMGGVIIGAAPVLSQAETGEGVARVMARIEAALTEMRLLLGAPNGQEMGRLAGLMEPLTDNLDKIRAQALDAIALRKRNEAMLREVLALHSDFVDESEPLVDDARFNVRALLDDIERRRGDGATAGAIARQTQRADNILQLSSHANLAIGLVGRIASVATEEQLALDSHFLAETLDAIRPMTPALEAASDTISLRQIITRLFELADAESGLPGLRKNELRHRADMAALVNANRDLIGRLDTALTGAARTAASRVAASGVAAQDSIRIGRTALLLIAAGAVAASLVVGILYVRSNLIRRIRTLSNAARSLADGRMPEPIAVTGSDELTDMARAMEGFRLAQGELVQAAKLAALGNLAAGIAHEINQPLNAIRSHVHNARTFQERGDGSGLARSLGKIDALVARAAHIITHLRRFARRSDVALSAVSLQEAAEGAIAILGPRIREVGAQVSCALQLELRVLAEDIRLEQVLVNLLANAVDAVAHEERREIRVYAERVEPGLVHLHVVDTGPGVPADLAATLFDPFVSSKPVGAGMGLGLSISYNIVRDFGGMLRVLKSEAGGHFIAELREAG
jgi:two-component system C4-dicarboxylate transport sensor histidine kinase DctB